MKRLILSLAILLSSLHGVEGGSDSCDLEIVSDGSVRAKPAFGEVTWDGVVSVNHSRFRMEVDGSVSLFSGPRIRKTSPTGVPLRMSDLTVEFEWISMVAIGKTTITVKDPSGTSTPVVANRVVYVPKKDLILIDGKPWKPSVLAQQ